MLCSRCRMEEVDYFGVFCADCTRQIREMGAWALFWRQVFGVGRAIPASIAEKLNQWAEDLDHDICPTCQQPIEEYKQMSRCVYAVPCWHRLYTGKVPDKQHKALKGVGDETVSR